MVKAEGGKEQESTDIGETSNPPSTDVSAEKTEHEGTSKATKSQEPYVGLSASHLHQHHHATSQVDSTPDATRQVVSASGIHGVGSSEEDDVRAASPLHSSTTLTTAASSSAGTSSTVLGAIHGPSPYVTSPQAHGIDSQGVPHLASPERHQSHEHVEHGDTPTGQYAQGHPQLYDPTRAAGSNVGGSPGSAPSRFPVAIKLLVSNNVAGSIIGRQGQTISELQTQSMTRIKLSQSGDYFPGTHDRVCLVQGEPGNIKVALRLLLHRMNMLQEQECSQRVAAWQQLQQSKQQMGSPIELDPQQVVQPQQPQQAGQDITHPSFNFVVRLLVPTSSCGMIIGKAGSNIKYLEQASGVISVRLSPKDALSPTDANVPPAAMGGPNSSSTMERAVTITGPNMESCLHCSYMVFEGMLSHPDVSRYSNMTTTYARHKAQQMLPHQMQMLEHQLAHTSLVGGAPGTEIGAGMNQPLVGHPNVPLVPNPVLPSGGPLQQQQPGAIGPRPQAHPLEGTFGSESNLLGAPETQAKMLDPSSSFPAPQNEPTNSKRGYLVPVSPICLGPNTFQAQVAVPDSMIGSILGRAGRTLNELQALSGTRIWISQRGEYIPGTRNRIVTVRGPTAHSVWQAQMLINQQIVLPPTAGHMEDHS